MDVVDVATERLATMAAPYNPRTITDHDLEALRRSLRTWGVVEPIVCNTRTGRVVGGHQRIRAAQAEGIPDLPVYWVDLDEASEHLLNLALNRISGEWDEEKLSALLHELAAGGADLGLSGFESNELDALLASLESPPGAPDPDEIPVAPNTPMARTGDLIRLGKH